MRTQVVRTAPQTVVIGQYITAKGIKLLSQPKLKKAEIEAIKEKYTKNKVRTNILSEPFREPLNLSNNPKGRTKVRRIKHTV